jgi:flagellin
MGQVINTNLASLAAQSSLNRSQGDVQTSLTRLSSGLRINSAKDDAAGLAISERFTSQIKGLNQAVRNANDAISLSQTAESSLSETTNLLQRLRELSVQSANATNSASDRSALQSEVSQVVAEIDRIANTAEFNGIKLLNGNFTSQAFQVGANANQTVAVSVNSAKTDALGAVNSATFSVQQVAGAGAIANTGSATATVGAQNLTFTTGGVASVVAVAAGDSAQTIAAAVTAGVDNLTAAAVTRVAIDTSDLTAGAATIVINGTTINYTSAANDATDATAIKTAIQASAALSNLTVTTQNGQNTGSEVLIVDSTGANMKTSFTVTGGGNVDVRAVASDGTTLVGTDQTTVATGKEVITTGDVTYTTSSAAAATIGIATSSGTTFISGAGNAAISESTSRVKDVNISTSAGAQTAIAIIDSAIGSVGTIRANLGAVQNRFESIVASLQSSSDNQSGARSRIVDADFAAETASLTRGQILQQAGIAVLAQANAAPQNVLSLLQ